MHLQCHTRCLAFDLNGYLPEHVVCASIGDSGEGMYCMQNSVSESLLVANALVSKAHVWAHMYYFSLAPS